MKIMDFISDCEASKRLWLTPLEVVGELGNLCIGLNCRYQELPKPLYDLYLSAKSRHRNRECGFVMVGILRNAHDSIGA